MSSDICRHTQLPTVEMSVFGLHAVISQSSQALLRTRITCDGMRNHYLFIIISFAPFLLWPFCLGASASRPDGAVYPAPTRLNNDITFTISITRLCHEGTISITRCRHGAASHVVLLHYEVLRLRCHQLAKAHSGMPRVTVSTV